jgi:hypothetical protein
MYVCIQFPAWQDDEVQDMIAGTKNRAAVKYTSLLAVLILTSSAAMRKRPGTTRPFLAVCCEDEWIQFYLYLFYLQCTVDMSLDQLGFGIFSNNQIKI